MSNKSLFSCLLFCCPKTVSGGVFQAEMYKKNNRANEFKGISLTNGGRKIYTYN